MSMIYQPLQTKRDGLPTGKWRMVAYSDEDSPDRRIYVPQCSHAHDSAVEASACPEAVARMGQVFGQHQDARIEDAIESSAAKIVDAIVTAVGDNVLGIEVGLALYATRSDLAQVARGALLDLLATLGVDTSAHVHAPEVEVRVHREPPHDPESR